MHQYPPSQIVHQLPLAIQLNDEATLSDFCWGQNTLIQQQINRTLSNTGERLIYLWGPPGCGKTHLLQGCCHAISHEQASSYLPLQLLQEWGPTVLEGIDNHTWIWIDDLDSIASNKAWEEAIFHLYNRVRDKEDTTLVIAGRRAPTQTAISLPDLRSRLSWGLVLQLHELDDKDKVATLTRLASKRGIELPPQVGQFVLKRCARNMHDLHTLLNRLDEASLATQRKITIPFVKSVLGL